MTRPPVLIAGAGIAGLTAAIALARAGVEVLLVERRPGFTEVGAGLQLSPNASSVLHRLGLAPAVARQAVAPRRLDIRRWDEPRSVSGMRMQDAPEPDGSPFWCLRRADLQTALLDQARMMPGIRLMVGRRIVALTQGAGDITVTVETERGASETLQASSVIGADGVWSDVRRLLGDAGQPAFTGHEAWRTLIPAAAAAEFARLPAVNLWLGRQGHAVHYPVATGRFINLVLIRKGGPAREGWTRDGDRSEVQGILAGAAKPLQALGAAAENWQVWSLFDRPPAVMAKGRAALIGDAAHPVLPFLAQGAGLAIEDAGVLASLLAPALADTQGGAIEAALGRFAMLRRQRAASVQETARSNGRIYHAGFPVALARDLVLRRLGDEGMRKRYAWLYGWRMDVP
jgi:salicylate hydroxylase